ncbi:MAG: DUF1801 domain-containing protein [Balneolaceae bacterium]|nr:DUF1801 domain-containing protein [Balneolaceae bacterium]MBO6546868.1 DUF1801 domain-containing protein [Balneolaceae bacterium]MBO6649228.1 DUF1801 domain-containing protein [Balneolaceae bacterium]
MSQNKTVPTGLSVSEYINAIEHPQRREDCWAVHDLMKKITSKEALMWGSSIVGFGTYKYKYESGREGIMITTGFSNRKQAITLYIMDAFKRHKELLEKIGPHKRGKSCFYIKRLSDIDIDILSLIISESLKAVEKKHTIID